MTSRQERKYLFAYGFGMEEDDFIGLELSYESSSFDEEEDDSSTDSETYGDSSAIISTGVIEPYQFEPLRRSSSEESVVNSDSEGTDGTTNNSARLGNNDW